MLDVYVPPLSEFNPPQPELVILFLQAVARKTPAFQELRDSILPRCDFPHMPSDEIEQWLKRWHLEFPNHRLGDMIYQWVHSVLGYWAHHPQDAKELKVDLNYFEQGRKIPRATDREPVLVTLHQWNPDREGFEQYAKRMRANFEKFLQEQKRTREQEMERFGMKPYRKRKSNKARSDSWSPFWDFEWLALHVCKQRSDAQIAAIPEYRGVNRESVKKARQALEARLQTRGCD